jgi:hypothetical protein
MAKSKFDTSFDFGANVAVKKARSVSKGSKRKRSAAQRATAALYIKPRRR